MSLQGVKKTIPGFGVSCRELYQAVLDAGQELTAEVKMPRSTMLWFVLNATLINSNTNFELTGMPLTKEDLKTIATELETVV